jgi:hypothetical protein
MAQQEIFPNQMKTVTAKDLEVAIAAAVSQLVGLNCTVAIDTIEHGCDGDCKGDATRFGLRVYQTFLQSMETKDP